MASEMAASLDSWLQEGIAAAQAGQAEQARACLLRVIQADERNLQAWYWLSRVVEDPQEREICLENVLALDPDHTAVQAELAALRRQRTETKATLLSKEAIAAAVPLGAEEELISAAAVKPLACPYCGALTDVAARQCPYCAQALVERRPKSQDHSIYSLSLVILWVGLANYTWLGLVAYYLFAGFFSEGGATAGSWCPWSIFSLPLSLVGGANLQFDPALWPVFLAGGAIFVFSMFVAWGLYRRYRFFYWLTIALIVLGFLGAIVRAATAQSVSLLGLAVQFGFFFLAISFAFMAYDEFSWLDQRLDASLDRDVDSHSALFTRGRRHARRGMWAKAAAHWSKAVALSPGHPDYRLALASAYLNLGQPQRAREHLAHVQRIEPDHPRLRELLVSLNCLTAETL